MSPTDRESIGDEYGVWSIDDEDQLQPEDTLDGEGDVLDRGFVPPDRLRGSVAHGITAEEQWREETIEQRIRQEEPDPDSAYGAPDNESGMDGGDDMIGGDDADAIRPELDYYGGESTRVGRLIAPDEGVRPDDESRMLAREGKATSWDSPEESAMHYLDEEEDNRLEDERDTPEQARPQTGN
ncbi:MAG: DUF5709 domain-containing protein [Ornithinimicrobium sp.]|uniref:DUF5709 domain-containing protein n=1 Tax=Ornithinimicrobium sp. TaxID=1977084 RepID=UPI0026DFA492|nr:DUF5709 domain-containing protein [Ornithinimicrobium sp.]MDO5739371.1 DUF5709 domain-containing protein [Ornithinimicrobium sp.]